MEKDYTDHPADAPPVRLAFRVLYLGSRFYGSQMQAASRTVEGEFVSACQRLSLFDDWRKAGFLSAGRTDRGVHARGQVIAFSTPAPERARTVINTQLPPDLWCTAYAEVPMEFHPRYDAKSRTYRYYFSKRPGQPDAMDRAAQQFLGSHNFSNFARVKDKNPYRNILAARVGEEDGFEFLEVKAESFLWHQVRCMAAALLLVGEGESDEGSIARLLEADALRPLQPAPAEGLILWETDCGITWTPITSEGQSGAFMDHLVRHYALMEKVCRVLKTTQV
ncbi:MAG: tRNA pseudouridine(38-40) synthase TruA [Methanomicrobiales archaeon HGW-Methanomicrobiales-1]|jgi:tRNA pseudouridine38-40 synthase|nr:MAG: tRNA pseudouridine(38-40) synthase TruA [Methanomicrobiales archaeon HGW-Methanomicrobiales-1]